MSRVAGTGVSLSGSAGDAELIVLRFFEGADGEKFVAARDAAVGGHAQQAFERCGEAGYVFGGDALEVVIAADRAVGGELARNWRKAGTKAHSAARAPPRQAADDGGGEIPESASARAAAGQRVAGGAIHNSRVFLRVA